MRQALASDPIRFVDVGARGGWQAKWRDHGEHVLYIGVEPDSAECARLRGAGRPNEIYVDRALYRVVGEVSLYHCDPPSRTSIYPPNREGTDRFLGKGHAIRAVRVDTVPVTTFDLAIEPLRVGAIDFVKLDTQGSELDILCGAERALAGPMVGLEVEVEFAPVYEGQPLFPDVASFLRARGFEFIDFPSTYSSAWIRFGHRGARGYSGVFDFLSNWASLVGPRGGLRRGHRLIYADAIFMREPAEWLAAVQRQGEGARTQGIRGVMSCCIVGYREHALDLAARLRGAGLLSAGELASLKAFVGESLRTWRCAAENAARLSRRLLHRLGHLRDAAR